jgi:ketosteroid isomerase-like protein
MPGRSVMTERLTRKESIMSADKSNIEQEQVRQILEEWACATRKDLQDDILKNHEPDAVIFDVLPPMKYDGTEAYRRSWDEWQPDTQGEGRFDLQNLSITTGADVAFAHCFIACGGSLPDGKVFEDVVRATFCLRKTEGTWRIEHQHVSKPFGPR